ncbi:MAG: tetratricopeptide repeat protein, partial [Chloroflexia bacterium]|nr:tetratricopeptide repeat protein [Chloroflexia bacterium]
LAAAPGVQLLVTSRERLSLSNEVCLKVEGLAYPLAQVDPAVTITNYSAIQLFLRLAHLEYAGPPPSAELLAISQICRILEGLPLGIELAAGLTPHLNCTTIAALLEHDRDRLQSTLHDAPLRHQSLRTVFERSWERLDPFEQRSYRRLAIFSGSFTAEAARSVAGTSSYALDLFLGKSLLRTSDQGYYELHEMLRYYANEQLASDPEQGAVRMAHSSYYLKLLSANLDALAGHAPRDAVHQLSRQFGNIRMAWHHAARVDTEPHLELAIEALLRYYVATSRFHEGEQAFATAIGTRTSLATSPTTMTPHTRRVLIRLLIARADCLNEQSSYPTAIEVAHQALDVAASYPEPDLEAAALIQLGSALWHQGLYRESRARYLQALRLARSLGLSKLTGQCLQGLGTCNRYLGKLKRAQRLYLEALAFARTSGDWRDHYSSLNSLGVAAVEGGHYAEGRRYYEASLQIARQVGVRRGEADLLNNLGNVAADQGDHRTAEAFLRQALAIFQDLGDRWGEGMALNNLGLVVAEQHNLTAAMTYYQQALERFRLIGGLQGEGMVIGNLATAYRKLGDLNQAERCYVESLTIYQTIGDRLGEGQAHMYAGFVRYLDGDYAAALPDLAQACRLFHQIGSRNYAATAQAFLGHAFAALGDEAQAQTAYKDALALRHALAQDHLVIEPLLGLAMLELARHRPAEALALIEPILDQVLDHNLDALEDPNRLIAWCAQILEAASDQRATAVLKIAQAPPAHPTPTISDPVA